MTEIVCDYCALPIAGGWHSPGWCMDWAGPERIERVPIVAPPAPPVDDRDERNRRYRAGLCTDCGQTAHAPARPRCRACHGRWEHGHEPALSRRRIAPCAQCGRPGAVPGNVLCGPCRRERSS